MIAVKSHDHGVSTTAGWFLRGAMPPEGHVVRFPIPEGRFQVGRRPDVNLCISKSSVSKLHAEFVATNFGLFVRDMGSTNGTFVNGRRIHQDTQLDECDVIRFAEFEFVVGRNQVQEAMMTQVCSSTDWIETLTLFHRLITERAVVPYFQPIVRMTDKLPIGYEVLARSTVPGLTSPREMFETAEQMNLADKLSVLCREAGIEQGRSIPGSLAIFLNTHPCEGTQTGLLPSLMELRRMAPDQPIVLELHEASMTDPGDVVYFRKALQDLEIGLAYDDFGAGQSRLQELAEVAPDYLKFDMSLIRDIHLLPQRQQIVSGLVRMSLDLGVAPIAEGIETIDEAEVCNDIGFTHAQGYYFGKPATSKALSDC